MIRFICPNCQKALKSPTGTTGRTGKCPKCKQSVEIPVYNNKPIIYIALILILLLISCIAIFFTIGIILFVDEKTPVSPVVLSPIVVKNKSLLEEGDELYELNRKTEAIAKYKIAYPSAGNRKTEIVARIIEQSLRDRNLSEYMKWCQQAIDDKLEPELIGDAKDMFDSLKNK